MWVGSYLLCIFKEGTIYVTLTPELPLYLIFR